MNVKEKAIENIRAVIEQQETEWLRENGFEPVPHRPEPRRVAPKKPGAGQFSANRFLGTLAPESDPEPEEEPKVEPVLGTEDYNEPEVLAEPEPVPMPEPEPVYEPEPSTEDLPAVDEPDIPAENLPVVDEPDTVNVATEPMPVSVPEPETSTECNTEIEAMPEPEPDITQNLQPEAGNITENDTEIEAEPEPDNDPEIIEVIKHKDAHHSWLYNEVMKAIRDASGDGRNTKVIAIFIPVVQNGKEFEDLPVNASVELPPVNEENLKSGIITEVNHAESLQIPTEDLPVFNEPDTPEENLQTFDEPDTENNDFTKIPEPDTLLIDLPAVDEPDTSAINLQTFDEPVAGNNDFSEIPETDTSAEDLPAVDGLELPKEDFPEIPEPETTNQVVDLLPEPIREPDPELAAAFRHIVEKLDDVTSEPVSDADSASENEDEPEVFPILPEENTELPEIISQEEPAESELEVLNLPEETETPNVQDWEKIPDIEFISVPDLPEAAEEEPAESDEPELVTEPELPDIPDMQDFTADKDFAEETENAEEYIAGQPLAFTEIPLPAELDDDEIFDGNELEKEKH